jgi:hypothetical protein
VSTLAATHTDGKCRFPTKVPGTESAAAPFFSTAPTNDERLCQCSDGGPPEEALSAADLLLFVVLDLIREAVKHITSWGETGVEARIDFFRFPIVKAKADGLG